MQFIYQKLSHITMLPHEIEERIEECELALWVARGAGMNSLAVQKLEKQLEYWQQVQSHYW